METRRIVEYEHFMLSACLNILRSCEPVRSAVVGMRNWRSAAIDRWMRIDTAATSSRTGCQRSLFQDGVFYEATDYMLLRRYFRPLRLMPGDTVFELGCGLGRTLCLFARQNVRRCIGVEVNPDLASKAVENVTRLRGKRAQVEVRAVDAALTDYDQGTVFWFNNPFGPSTLRAVMTAIGRSLIRAPRNIRIAYIYPHHKSVIEEQPWLTCYYREKSAFFGTSEALYWSNFESTIGLGVHRW